MATTVTHHFGTGITTWVLTGERDITGRAGSGRWSAVARRVTNAVIVDSRDGPGLRHRATVFPALCSQQAHHDTPVPVLLHAPRDTPTGEVLRSAIGGYVPVHPDRSAAVRVLEGFEAWQRRGHLHMPPVAASAAASRHFAIEFCGAPACRQWRPGPRGGQRVVKTACATRDRARLAMACGRAFLSISVATAA